MMALCFELRTFNPITKPYEPWSLRLPSHEALPRISGRLSGFVNWQRLLALQASKNLSQAIPVGRLARVAVLVWFGLLVTVLRFGYLVKG